MTHEFITTDNRVCNLNRCRSERKREEHSVSKHQVNMVAVSRRIAGNVYTIMEIFFGYFHKDIWLP
jgi:hypothetical protein